MKNNTRKLQKLFHVPFTNVIFKDSFWAPRLKRHQDTTIDACIKQCDKTGRILNFDKAAGIVEGKFEGVIFNDSDVYKVIEGIGYSLMNNPNNKLEEYTDYIIDKICAAQESDGYLFTAFTLEDKEKRWTDMMAHEDYCGGHLIEAAIAYKKATGKDKLLKTACKMADHYISVFIGEKCHWTTGHQEIELALIKLYRETGDEKYLKLSQWFIEERGHGYGFAGYVWNRETFGGATYNQDDKPIRELTDIRGHAVRAMYYYCAVADLAEITGDSGYLKAMDSLWESVTLRNMYITGGIGPSKSNEGFTEDYDLPNETAYCETCASIGMVYWNYRMNLLYGNSKYGDIVERAMYNGSIAGVSLSGDKFFYENPLASNGSHHRVKWYDVSCCPTQISRFIPSIGDYIYNTSEDGIWINLYAASEGTIDTNHGKVKIIQSTNYPWDGKVTIAVDTEAEWEFEIMLRLPGWCRSAGLSINSMPIENYVIENGYIKIFRKWAGNDIIEFSMDMPVERVYSHPSVKANEGKVSIQRGPLVYCIEEVDNKYDFNSIELHGEAKFILEYRDDLLGGVVIISAIDSETQKKLTLVPYYTWDNREPGCMQVWIKEKGGIKGRPLYWK